MLRKIYDCTFSAIVAQGRAKAEQAAAKKHRTAAKPKVKPNQFVKKPATPIKPIAPIAATPAPQPVPVVPLPKPQAKPVPRQVKMPNSLKPLPSSVLNHINDELPTPNDVTKNLAAS